MLCSAGRQADRQKTTDSKESLVDFQRTFARSVSTVAANKVIAITEGFEIGGLTFGFIKKIPKREKKF